MHNRPSAMTIFSLVSLLLSISILTLAGCGQNDRPKLGNVHGVVTLDGRPLSNATVWFDPGNIRASSGITNAQGEYELVYIRDIMGAAVGKHDVRISTKTESQPETVPAKYNTSTTLTATVVPGDNQFDFNLASGGL